MELKIRLLQSLPGLLPEKILQQWSSICSIEVKQVFETTSKEKIIEFRLEGATITYHYEEGFPCHVSYLFPDDDDEIKEFIRYFDQHYACIQRGVWLNQTDRTILEVIEDEDVGYMISCTKSKMN